MSQMLLQGKLLVLFCVGLAVVPGVQSLNCTDILSYKYLNDFVQIDKCESVDLELDNLMHNRKCMSANTVWHLLDDLQKHNSSCRIHIQNLLSHSYNNVPTDGNDNCVCTPKHTLTNKQQLHNTDNQYTYSGCRDHAPGSTYSVIERDLFTHITDHGCRNQNYLWPTLAGVKDYYSNYSHVWRDCTLDLITRAALDYPSQDSDSCVCVHKTITSSMTTTTTSSTTQQATTPTTTTKAAAAAATTTTITTKSDVATTRQTTVSSHNENGWESWSPWTCKITKSDLLATCHNFRQRHCLSNMATECEGPSFETMDCNDSQCSDADITNVNCSLYNRYSTCEDQTPCTYFSNNPWQICGDAAYVAQCPRLCTCCPIPTTSPTTTATQTTTPTTRTTTTTSSTTVTQSHSTTSSSTITTSPTTTSTQTTTTPKPEAVMTNLASTSTTMTKATPTASSTTTIITDQATVTTQPRTTETTKTQQSTDPIISTTTQQPSSMKPDIFGICNFDDGNTCIWTQSIEDSFDWSLQSGPTLTDGTGPNNDHTLNTSQGKYLFVETSSPRLAGEQASLLSPELASDHTVCLEFWYYMFGDGIGSLQVHATDAYSKNAIELFKMDGDQGERWIKASVTILRNQIPNNYRIVITGNVGSTFKGDTAIDDIALNDGACKDSMATSTHSAAPSSDSTTAVTLTTLETSTLGAYTTEIHLTSINQAMTAGQWSEWFNGKCSATCGFGTQHRVRFCSTGQNADCTGSSTDLIPCNEQNCIQPAASWSEWFYGMCSKTCGDGHQQKFRICSTGNAMDCLGSQAETVYCNLQACPATASLPQCNHACTQDAVILSMAVKNSKADNCSDETSASNEALPMDCCNMGDHNSWIKGVQVQTNQVCTDGTPPPYTPIAAYNGTGLIPDSAGIFYGCIKDGQSGFRMVHQTCELLPHLLHVDGTQGKDPNMYFMIY